MSEAAQEAGRLDKVLRELGVDFMDIGIMHDRRVTLDSGVGVTQGAEKAARLSPDCLLR